MAPILPSSLKSECPKKQVKRPPAPRKSDRRPPFDNSLFVPKRKPGLKNLPGEDKKTEVYDTKKDKDEPFHFGMLADRCCTKEDCQQMGCYAREECKIHRPPIQKKRVICDPYPPCAHPRFPQCDPPPCYPIQCYRTGPEEPMKCCRCQPYSLPSRMVYCHNINTDDGNTPSMGMCPKDYQFS